MPADLTFHLLGPFTLSRDGQPVQVSSSRLRALLATMALSAGEPVTAVQLAERVWAPAPLDNPRNALYTNVVRLRRLIGNDAIRTVPDGYLLDIPAANVDLLRFRELVEEAAAARQLSRWPQELELLREALGLWRGQPFTGVQSAWLDTEIAPRVAEERFAALNRRISLELAGGRHLALIPELRELTGAYPLQEAIWEKLVLALHRAGRRADALDAFRQAREVLRDELGLDPGRELEQLHRAVLAADDPIPQTPRAVAFVGRRSELRWLAEAYAAAAAGHVRVALISGEAGVGKTRLVEQFVTGAAVAEAHVLSGACVKLGSDGLPLAPFLTALRSLVDRLGVAAVGELLPGVRLDRFRPDFDVLDSTDPAQQVQVSQLFSALLQRVSRRRPVVLVVEDLHWADRSSLDLLAMLARSLGSARVLVIATYRTDDVRRGHPLRAFLGELERLRWVESYELPELTRAETGELVAARLAQPPSPSYVDRIHAHSGGNAFFVEELLHADVVGTDAADTLRGLLLSQLERLSEPAQRIVRVAAVGAEHLPHELLAAAAGLPEERLIDLLREAVDARVLMADRTGYTFRHELVRDAVAGDLLPGERLALHRKYAAALSDHPHGTPADRTAAQLAHHWVEAAEPARALPALLSAADVAASVHAYPEQHQLLAHALLLWSTVDSPPHADRLAVAELAATAAHRAGDKERALEMVDETLAGLDTNGVDRDRHALLLARRGRLLIGLGRPGALAELERAERLATAPAARASVLEVLGVALIHTGSSTLAAETSREAARLADELGNAEQRVAARLTLGMALSNVGADEDGLAELHVARAVAEEHREIAGLTRVHTSLSYLLWAIGRYAESVDIGTEGLAVAREAGLLRSVGCYMAANVAASQFALGHWDDAEKTVTDVLELDPPGAYGADIRLVAADLALSRGDLRRARQMIATARETLAGHRKLAQAVQPLARLTTAIALLEGRVEDAKRDVADILFDITGWRGDAAHTWPLLITAARLESRTSGGLATVLRRVADTLPTDAPPWRAARLHFLAEMESGWDDVVDAWEAAQDPYRAAYARVRAADAAITAGNPGKAAKLLDFAVKTARRLRAAPLLRAAEKLLATLR